MKMKKIKLQIFFIAIALYNILYKLVFFFFIRRLLLRLAGMSVGNDSIVNSVRFFSFGKLVIGENSLINSGCYLDNRRGIRIGNNVVIAHDSKIYTLGHDYNDAGFKTKGATVTIEDYSVIFANATIMPGVTVKRGAVILPSSVVTKDVDEMTVVGGNPAKPIKKRENLHVNKPIYKYWFAI